MTTSETDGADASDSPTWVTEIQRLFGRQGRLAPETCPKLAELVASWLLPTAAVNRIYLENFVRSVLWHCDRREERPQTGEQWSALRTRRGLREGILGYLFLPRQDETSGLPVDPTHEELVRGKDSQVKSTAQAHRQRWAALRQAETAGKHYEPSSLFELGRRAARGPLPAQLAEDIRVVISNEDELADVLMEFVRFDDIGTAWQQRLHQQMAVFDPDYDGPPATVSATHAARESHFDESTFVRDVTIPDGTVIPRGTTFTKTWEVRNTGTTAWIGRRLRRITPTGNTLPSSSDEVSIPDTAPGQAVQISVDLTTSHVEGSTEIRFKMVDGEGKLCFPNRYAYGLTVLVVTQGRPLS